MGTRGNQSQWSVRRASRVDSRKSEVYGLNQTEPCHHRPNVQHNWSVVLPADRLLHLSCLAGSVICLCCSRGPRAIQPPDIDAATAAATAMADFDADLDGSLDAEELNAVPGLLAGLAMFDTNSDKRIQRTEIEARVNAWQAAGLMTIRCDVSWRGKPLEGATVTYVPEAFLGEDIQTAVGNTNQFGTAYMSIPKENRPTVDAPGGVQLGVYRVRISKLADGVETIPARYNGETILGQEISYDDPGVQSGIRYELK